MDLSRWDGGDARRDSGAGRRICGRGSIRVKPACEALDGRQLLSTVAAAQAVLPAPSATAVANAAAELNARDPSTFARLQGELAQAESHSRVTLAQATKLARDEAALDQAILTVGHDRSAPSELLRNVQYVNDQIDNAFFGDMIAASQEFIASLREAANRPESWGQLQGYLSSLSISPSVVHQTAHQMEVVARAVHLAPRLKRAFWNGYNTLNPSLGMSPDTDLGPGAADLDALQVYFDGQVNNFIKG